MLNQKLIEQSEVFWALIAADCALS